MWFAPVTSGIISVVMSLFSVDVQVNVQFSIDWLGEDLKKCLQSINDQTRITIHYSQNKNYIVPIYENFGL